MAIRMQQRRGTSEQWTLANPVLAPGEVGFETDNSQFKIGDGVNQWNDLAYFINADGISGTLGDYIELAEKGAADGVATLDETGQVPASQLSNATVDLTGYATETYVDTAEADAISTASSDATSKANAAQAAAEGYADGLSVNYDVAGSAATAESNSNTYTDDLIGDVTVDGTAGNTVTDRISTAVSGLVDSAPAALDTLNELAAALGDDENFSTTVTNAIAAKADSSHTHGLADLTDFDVDTPTQNQVLKFDGTAWINAAAGGGIQASEEPPVDTEAFPLWYNTEEGRAYIYYDSFWVELTPSIAGPQGEAGRFTVSETAPASPVAGDGWFNSVTAKLFVYYDSFWVEATGNLVGPSGVIAVTSPITNSGTSTSATIGIDQTALAINMSQVETTVNDKSAGYTLVAGDANTFIRSTGSAITITVPDVLANGESVNFIQAGAEQITFAGDAITINSKDAKLKTAAQFSGATITKLGGAYYLVGDLGE